MTYIKKPCGAGKGFVSDYLKKEFNLTKHVLYTTRKKRDKEQEGIDYYFISEESFKNKELLYITNYNNNYYGSDQSDLKNNDIIYQLEPKQMIKIKEKHQDLISIFILPPNLEILLKRRVGRDDKRLLEDYQNLSYINNYDYLLINSRKKDTYNSLKEILLDHNKSYLIVNNQSFINEFKKNLKNFIKSIDKQFCF